MRLPDVGIEVMEGEPGAGKSFWAVKRAIGIVAGERRPVYTNLPFRWAVVRAYLRMKYGVEVASLLRPLTLEQFNAFLARVKMRADLVRDMRKALGEQAVLRHAEVERRWEAMGGNGPSWIEPYSVIMIDEFQEWFPMRAQKDESPLLMDYATMHRHMLHNLIVITQDRMQITITLRRLAGRFWRAYNKRDQQFAWSLTWGHLTSWIPICAVCFGYTAWTGQDVREGSEYGARPFMNQVVFPLWPSNAWVFRVYDSFSRVGSRYRMKDRLIEARSRAGLDEAGRTPAEKASADRVARNRWFYGAVGWTSRMARRLALVLVGAGVGVLVSGGHDEPALDPVDVPAVGGPVAKGGPAAPVIQWGEWTGGGDTWARIAGERVEVGSDLKSGGRLQYASRDGLVVLRDGDVWVWKRGTLPERLGDARTVAAAAAEVLGGQPPDGDAGSGAGVGPRAGELLGGQGPVQ